MTITKSQYVANIVESRFFADFRELISHYAEASAGITAFLQMNNADELISLSKTPDVRLYRKLLCEALVTLIDRNAFTQLADLNDLAEAEIARLRRETGIGTELLPPPSPKPPTADELLRQEIANDWLTLSMEKIRTKRSANRKYSDTLDAMANEGVLDSQVTAIARLGA